jgi:hypothetical protein
MLTDYYSIVIFMDLTRIIVNRNILILAETTRTNPTATLSTGSVGNAKPIEQTCYVS